MVSSSQLVGTSARSTRARGLRRAVGVAGVAGVLLGVLTGLLWGDAVATWVGIGVATIAAALVVPVDIKWHVIPNRVTFPTTALLLGFTVAGALCGRDPQAIQGIGVCAVVVFVGGSLISRFGTLGPADVKLATILALGFGALGPGAVFGLFIVILFANGVIAVALWFKTNMNLKDFFPQAPGYFVGAVVTITQQLF